jgi:phosphoglycerate dehydrogenase-like enzyme
VVPTLTIVDDYQGAAYASVDWSSVASTYEIQSIREHLAEDELATRLRDTEVLVVIRQRTALTATLLERLPGLRLVIATGLNHSVIDFDSLERHGVRVAHTTGSGDSGVPELTIGMIIALFRNIVQEDAAMRAGGWQQTIGMRLAGKTMGILGLGRLGQPVSALARALDMTVIAWSPNLTQERAEAHGVRAVTKAELFAQSDVVTVHMPLNDATVAIVGAEDIARMKPTAYLINTSRGPLVDESALVTALTDNMIAGAGLDVFDTEPLPVDHPLRSLPNTLLSPHLGYVTVENYRNTFEQVLAIVVDFTQA